MSGGAVGGALSLGGTLLGSMGGGGNPYSGLAGAYNEAAKTAGAWTMNAYDIGEDAFKKSLIYQETGQDKATSYALPYNYAGYNALDAYQQSLGLPTLPGGSFGMQQALERYANAEQADRITNQQSDYYMQKFYEQGGPGNDLFSYVGKYGNGFVMSGDEETDLPYLKQLAAQSGDQAFIDKVNYLSDVYYNDIKPNYRSNKAMSGLSQQDKDLKAAYDSGNFDSYYKKYGSATDPNAGTKSFLATPEAQLLFKGYDPNKSDFSNFTNNDYVKAILGNIDPNASPEDNFRADPGYDYRVNEMMKATQRQASAGGYLNTPRLQQALQDRAFNLADQTYNNWQANVTGAYGAFRNDLTNSYRSYQGNLAQMAGMGQAQSTNSQNQNINANNNLANTTVNQGMYGSDMMTTLGSIYSNGILGAAQGNAAAQGYSSQKNKSMMSGLGSALNQAGSLFTKGIWG